MIELEDPISVTRCAPGQRTPKDKIKLRDRLVCYSTQARGLSGETMLTKSQREDEAEVMSVVMNQPHRGGVSPFPGDAWMATALGRFCRALWRDKETQRDYWDAGERYAQLVDLERVSRGLMPRQAPEKPADTGLAATMDEVIKFREEAAQRLSEAEDAMREVDAQAVRAVRTLAWDDLDISRMLYGRAYHALYKLTVHFERVDKPRRT